MRMAAGVGSSPCCFGSAPADRAGEGAARGRRQVGGVLPAAVGDRTARLFQGCRPRRRDHRRGERRPRPAVDRRRQRRDRHRQLRPCHPDAGQGPAGGGAAAIRPLSGLRAGDDGGQGRPLQVAGGPEGAEDRRHLARLQPRISWRPTCWCAAGSRPTTPRSSAPAPPRPRSRRPAAPRSTPSSAPIR